MAKKTKSKQSKKGGGQRIRRQERRFVSQTATNPKLVYALAWAAAAAIGAGAWAFFYSKSFADESSRSIPQYIVAAGIVLLGITIWMGTSSEPPIRVGAPGVALEKGELRRMPWWAIDKITFEPGALAVVVAGKDESGTDWTLKVPVKAHPDAIGWLVKEALDRIPRRVDIPEETIDKLPAAHDHGGELIELEPLQVVGKRCAATGKTISYEPDAVVCPRCERTYLKRAVPKKCKCGNSLVHLRPKVDDAEASDEAEAEDDADDESGAADEAPPASEPRTEKAEETA